MAVAIATIATVACGSPSRAEPTPIHYWTPTSKPTLQVETATPTEKPVPSAVPTETPTPTPDASPILTPEPTTIHPWPSQLTEADIDAVLELAEWPREIWAEARAVAWCESRWQSAATNGFSYGLFQVVPLWFDYSGLPFNAWADPVTNARAALGAYRYSNGWGQWVCQPQR